MARKTGLRRTIIPAVVAAAAFGGGALAQTPPPAPAQAPAQAPRPDPAFEAAKTAFEALPEADRRAIQDALVWTGDYNAGVGGGFGRRTFEGIQAFQRRAKAPADGMLDSKGRADLLAAAQRARDAVRFTMVLDPRTGARLGIPERLLPKQDSNPNGGVRWQSADGRITLDTRAVPAGEGDLTGLYERNLAIQTPGRQVTYKVLRPEFFVIAGETPSGKFYSRYAAGPGGLRGFSLGYDKALAKDFDRMVVAIANSFTPFPDALPATAAAPPLPPRPPGAPDAPRPAGPAGGPAATGPAASGILVAPRRVLTLAAVEACAAPLVAGAPARVAAVDKDAGLALLAWDVAREAPPPALKGADPAPREELLVLGFTALAGAGGPSLVVVPAEAGAGRLTAPLQPGFAGGPAFDRSGALAGLVGPLPATPRQVAGVVPPASHPLVGVQAVARFLAANGVTLPPATPGTRTAGEIAAAAGAAVVPVGCAR